MTIADYLREEGKKEGHLEGREEGRLEGREEGHQEIFEAIDLIQKGLNLEVIANETGLTLERVQQLTAVIEVK